MSLSELQQVLGHYCFYCTLAFVTKCPTVSQPTCLNGQMVNRKTAINLLSLQPTPTQITLFSTKTTKTFGIIIFHNIKCTVYDIIPFQHPLTHTLPTPRAIASHIHTQLQRYTIKCTQVTNKNVASQKQSQIQQRPNPSFRSHSHQMDPIRTLYLTSYGSNPLYAKPAQCPEHVHVSIETSPEDTIPS